ncbi:unnamed protein product [Plutella xylostella]|uniref:(diamondback moth) hypothetical protein n=1 Tax=Plutella xylostella TaxID=51655 RepID=A0A8S4ERK8_PLUXY|nr:unnamed protein product [Plutella xylostella]
MSKSSVIKTAILDIKLINLVKDNPVLYDHNDLNYVNFNAREVVWQKIGDEMKRPASECKARWINIRDINRRIIKKSLKNPGSVSKMYKYYNELSFMRPFYKDVMIQNSFAENEETSNNSKQDEDIDDDDDDDSIRQDFDDNDDESDDDKPIKRRSKVHTAKSSLKKRKKKSIEALEKIDAQTADSLVNSASDFDPTDKVDAFLLSIGATLKTFSPYHLNLAKSKIFAVVQEHELQQIVSKQQSNDVQVQME